LREGARRGRERERARGGDEAGAEITQQKATIERLYWYGKRLPARCHGRESNWHASCTRKSNSGTGKGE
jgi:hypothetical protein